MEAVVFSPNLQQVVRSLKKMQPSEISKMLTSLSNQEMKAVQGNFGRSTASATAANYWN